MCFDRLRAGVCLWALGLVSLGVGGISSAHAQPLGVQVPSFPSEVMLYGRSAVWVMDNVEVGEGAVGSQGTVGSQGVVTIGRNVEVGGDVFGRSVSLGSRSTVQGDATALQGIRRSIGASVRGEMNGRAAELPQVRMPMARVSSNPDNDLQVNGWQSISGSAFGDIVVQRNATLLLKGGVIHAESLTLEEGATLQVAYPTELRIRSGLILAENTWVRLVHQAHTAQDLKVYVEGGMISMGEDTKFQGLISAPNSLLFVGSNTRLQGSFLAHQVMMQSGVHIAWEAGCTTSPETCDAADNDCDGWVDEQMPLCTDGDVPVEPNPPELLPNELPSVFERNRFLYTGDNPVQKGVEEETIVPERASVLRGQVFQTIRDAGGEESLEPLPAVKVSIKDHPELGYTLTRQDGWFDLVINGGGWSVLEYEKPGCLPVYRKIKTGWQQYGHIDNVAMIPLDSEVTEIDLSRQQGMAVHQASVVNDQDGERCATLMIPEGTEATAVLQDGTELPLDQVHIRATEYTVGENGPEAMPASIATNTSYTYAMELSIDEAILAGADTVTFSQPLPYYVENFLNFPVGMHVPVGYYNPERAAWVPEENGRVISIVGINEAGEAEVIATRDGEILDQEGLEELGFSEAELRRLAETYGARLDEAPSVELWRVLVEHFSSIDCNVFASTAIASNATTPPLPGGPGSGKPTQEQHDCSKGSIIDCHNQNLGERVDLVGTPYALHYNSKRTSGRLRHSAIRVPVNGPEQVPDSVLAVYTRVEIAGQVHEMEYAPRSNFVFEFQWDGMDVYGRRVIGEQTARIAIGYVYEGRFYEPGEERQNFGSVLSPPHAEIGGSRERIRLSRIVERTVQKNPILPMGLEGWSTDAHHTYSVKEQVLYLGDGQQRSSQDFRFLLQRVAGTDLRGFSGDGGPALDAQLQTPVSMTVGPDGSVYFMHVGPGIQGGGPRIRKIDPQGIITTIAGNGRGAGRNAPLEGIATEVPLSFAHYLSDIEIDRDGNVYFTEYGGYKIRKLSPDGYLTTVVGNGQVGLANGERGEAHDIALGAGQLATDVAISPPLKLAIDSEKNLYFSDYHSNRIWRVGQNGILSVARYIFGSNGGGINDLEVDSQDRLFYQYRGVIYRLDPNGVETRMASAPSASEHFTISPEGDFIVASFGNVLKFNDQGEQEFMWGGRDDDKNVHNQITPQHTYFSKVTDVAIHPLGDLYLAIGNYVQVTLDHTIARVIERPFPQFDANHLLIPSQDGNMLYRFNASGRHLETVDAMTGHVIHGFGYHADGSLAAITDTHGRTTSFNPSEEGNAMVVTSPDGHVTQLRLNEDRQLVQIQPPDQPEEGSYLMTYLEGSLLETWTDPNGHTWEFTYDEDGRLIRDTDPEGGFKRLERQDLEDGYQVALSTQMGRTTTYTVDENPINPESPDEPWGAEVRTTTEPDGSVEQTVVEQSGVRTVTYSDGSQIESTLGADPRFGLQAAFSAEQTMTLPSGIHISLQQEKAMAHNPVDYLDVQNQTVTHTVNAGTEYERELTTTTSVVENEEGEKETEVNFTLRYPNPLAEGESIERQLLRQQRNAEGLTTVIDVPGTGIQTMAYDEAGRITEFTWAEGQRGSTRRYRWEYNEEGWVALFEDAEHRETFYTAYDEAGRVLCQMLPGEITLGFGYDSNGQLAALTTPNGDSHGFTYNGVGLETTYAPPVLENVEVPQTAYSYNLDRQLTAMDLAGNEQVALVYDEETAQLTSMAAPHGIYTYAYDGGAEPDENGEGGRTPSGQLLSISAPGIDGQEETLHFAYDGFVQTSERWEGTVSGSVEVNYDVNGDLVSDFLVEERTINGAHAVRIERDGEQYPIRVGAVALTYNPETKFLRQVSLGNTTSTFAYNGFGELVEAQHVFINAQGQEQNLAQWNYRRDALGRIREKTEQMLGEESTRTIYTYDDAGRLREVHTGEIGEEQVSEAYGYDDNGNRMAVITDERELFAQDILIDAQDRLVQYGDETFAYKANGELLEKTETLENGEIEVTQYNYDVFSNLRSVTLPNGQSISYVIDGQHRRVGEYLGENLTQGLLYKDALNPIAKLDGEGNVQTRFVYASKPHVPDYMVMEGAPYRFITDHLGSVRLVVNATTGEVLQRLDYDSYGKVLNDTNPEIQPFGFAGGLYEPSTKLVRFGARDYNPHTARWTSKDPIRFAGGDPNLYGYVLGDPVNFIDPKGLNLAVAGFLLEILSVVTTALVIKQLVIKYDSKIRQIDFQGRAEDLMMDLYNSETLRNLPEEAARNAMEHMKEHGHGLNPHNPLKDLLDKYDDNQGSMCPSY